MMCAVAGVEGEGEGRGKDGAMLSHTHRKQSDTHTVGEHLLRSGSIFIQIVPSEARVRVRSSVYVSVC